MRTALLGLFLLAPSAFALEPKDVIVVVNRNVPESLDVAEHYLAKRKVPKENLILLDLPKGEDISRAEYDAKLAGPLREALKDRRAEVKVLLAVYGVPLRVGWQILTTEEKKDLDELSPKLEAARKKVAELEKDKTTDAKDLAAARSERDRLELRRKLISHNESHACVDSELMLLWWKPYPLDRWVYNPLYFQASDRYRKSMGPTLMTARLDGPTPEIAKRLVDDAIAVEAKGLSGSVVVDARGIRYDSKGNDGTGYSGYDESFREMAKLFEPTDLPVKLEDTDKLIPAGTHKNVALYSGWYSHGNFIDSSEFVPGAVAWHLASSEAVSLRKSDAKLWCPNLLKKGVAATIGPVAEPYTIGFPKPAEFFGFLATGEFTLVESYSRSLLFCSWMTVLVGDPLYNPFAKNPKLKSADVLPSPKGIKLGFP